MSYSKGYVVGQTLQGKRDERIGLLDSKTGREIKTLTGHAAPIGRVAFSPNGKSLLSESADSTARLWDVNTGGEVRVIKLKERGASVAFSSDGRAFAVATQPVGGTPPQPIVGLYDASTGALLREFPRLENVVTSLAFVPNRQSAGDRRRRCVRFYACGNYNGFFTGWQKVTGGHAGRRNRRFVSSNSSLRTSLGSPPSRNWKMRRATSSSSSSRDPLPQQVSQTDAAVHPPPVPLLRCDPWIRVQRPGARG